MFRHYTYHDIADKYKIFADDGTKAAYFYISRHRQDRFDDDTDYTIIVWDMTTKLPLDTFYRSDNVSMIGGYNEGNSLTSIKFVEDNMALEIVFEDGTVEREQLSFFVKENSEIARIRWYLSFLLDPLDYKRLKGIDSSFTSDPKVEEFLAKEVLHLYTHKVIPFVLQQIQEEVLLKLIQSLNRKRKLSSKYKVAEDFFQTFKQRMAEDSTKFNQIHTVDGLDLELVFLYLPSFFEDKKPSWVIIRNSMDGISALMGIKYYNENYNPKPSDRCLQIRATIQNMLLNNYLTWLNSINFSIDKHAKLLASHASIFSLAAWLEFEPEIQKYQIPRDELLNKISANEILGFFQSLIEDLETQYIVSFEYHGDISVIEAAIRQNDSKIVPQIIIYLPEARLIPRDPQTSMLVFCHFTYRKAEPILLDVFVDYSNAKFKMAIDIITKRARSDLLNLIKSKINE
ncbi:MAG: hypothetical protein INQ03_25230 [Candidatus Heimdallarchaeota archaeon]|nr:hypothetical protein [Candidatus Heimdallarchaeota archaeon]